MLAQLQNHRQSGGMSENTVRKYVGMLEEKGLVLTEPTTVFTRDGMKRNGTLLYTILPIQQVSTSGLRRGELMALLWEDLDVENRILSVSKQVVRVKGQLEVTEPKTSNSIRKVALPRQTVELLIQEHEKHPDNPIMFPSPRTGSCWSPDGVSRINKNLLARAGIDTGVRFHDLRHTFATMAMQSGVDARSSHLRE